MNNILHLLSSHVSSIEKVDFTNDLKSKFSNPFLQREAEKNSNLIQAYRFVYKSGNNEVAGFLAAPQAIHSPLPLLVYNRGGSFDFGLVTRGLLMTDIATMASWGYIIVGSQYTGNSLTKMGRDEFGGHDDLASVKDLISLASELSFVDKNRIGMFGESRGGMMTYLLLRDLPKIKAAVVRAGVTNLIRNAELRPEMQEVFTKAFGGTEEEKKKRSIIFDVKSLPDVPLLIMHGDADWRVAPADSDELAERLAELERPHNLIAYSNDNHGLTNHRKEWLDETRSWLKRYL